MPQGVHPLSIHVVAFRIIPFNPDLVNKHDQTAKVFGVEDELNKASLMILPLENNISKIDLNLKDNPVFVKCPKMPSDLEAKIGYRRSKYTPDKKEKVFGFLAVISTAVEPETGLELPIAALTSTPASKPDGKMFIPLKEQIKSSHPSIKTYADIGDAGFDMTYNYHYVRKNGSFPFFDYNPRGENLSQQALWKRGYDQYGHAFAPCKITCHPNGYDPQEKRLSFVCRKQCLSKNAPQPIKDCPHFDNECGYSTHIPISRNPRLFTEIPRNTKRWKEIRNLRSSAERTNSGTKSDLDILERPKVYGLKRAAVLTQIACIALLIKRFLSFVINISLTLRKYWKTKDLKLWYDILKPRPLKPSIAKLIQRE